MLVPGQKKEPGAAITRPRFMGPGGMDTETMSNLQENKNPRQLAIDLVRYMGGGGGAGAPDVVPLVATLRALQEALLDACVSEARGILRGILTAMPPEERVTLDRGPLVVLLVRKEPWQSDRDVRQEELIAGARLEGSSPRPRAEEHLTALVGLIRKTCDEYESDEHLTERGIGARQTLRDLYDWCSNRGLLPMNRGK